MSYSKLLMKFIAESGYTYNQIIDKCEQNGKKVDKAYLSRLVNNKVSPPSEELSRVLSKVLNVDERKLVIEGYLEKAPEEIKKALLSIKISTYMLATNFFENKFDEEVEKQIEEKLKEEPLSDFVIALIDGMENVDNLNKKDFNLKLEEPLSIPIEDNAMFPKIVANSKIILKIENKYQDGDILAIKIKDEEKIIVRMAFINNENIKLVSLNKQYETLEYNISDIIILGKVTKVITDI